MIKLMKNTIFGLMIFFAAMTAGAQSSGAVLYVAVKSAEVKASSGFFARTLGALALGEEVTVRQNQGRWLVVRNAAGLEGWVQADAFSTRRIVQTGSGVTAAEFALAGKGFSGDLEDILRAAGDFDFSAVDAMEERVIPPQELHAFLTEGRLAEGN